MSEHYVLADRPRRWPPIAGGFRLRGQWPSRSDRPRARRRRWSTQRY